MLFRLYTLRFDSVSKPFIECVVAYDIVMI